MARWMIWMRWLGFLRKIEENLRAFGFKVTSPVDCLRLIIKEFKSCNDALSDAEVFKGFASILEAAYFMIYCNFNVISGHLDEHFIFYLGENIKETPSHKIEFDVGEPCKTQNTIQFSPKVGTIWKRKHSCYKKNDNAWTLLENVNKLFGVFFQKCSFDICSSFIQ